MPGVICPPMQFSEPQVLFLCKWFAFRDRNAENEVELPYIGTGISRLETGFQSGSYRLATENPGVPATVPKGQPGNDISLIQINDGPNAWPTEDPFLRFDPCLAFREMRRIYFTQLPSGTYVRFIPWGVPKVRTREILQIDRMRAEHPNPLAVENNPYWAMRQKGLPTYDLPRPPANEFNSGLPNEPLKFGNHGGANATSPTHGASINVLQRRLHDVGLYPAQFDEWYGRKTRGLPVDQESYGSAGGVYVIQQRLALAGLYDGPLDGNLNIDTLNAWEGALHFKYLLDHRI